MITNDAFYNTVPVDIRKTLMIDTAGTEKIMDPEQLHLKFKIDIPSPK